MRREFDVAKWRGMQGSNLRHSQSKCDVLPTELIPYRAVVEHPDNAPGDPYLQGEATRLRRPNERVAFCTGIEPVWSP